MLFFKNTYLFLFLCMLLSLYFEILCSYVPWIAI